ncbi:uncharacterized protein MELLADRAFT_85961 [Melampsora larici-populina 98AG31]|uniref:Uncharacterized protein n=1 Tax=Melampsora larici-populina (strain 98AG31 / pathotype 3-4-7) TaxID=747676 RepID=F4RKA4_MELLP|nr:uncharacterized protein MELLADRAFT_85961 [Melampsora larici-populina 98AG31]EGG07060.1 hypothetical protein MELLADRAFT_85961 [Melampsora larici-populina 98AG31]
MMANIATDDIPPNTPEFWDEIKKSQWIHPDMGVDDRVNICLQGRARQLQAKSSVMADIKHDLAKIGNKCVASGSSKMTDIKPDLKKIKGEEQPKGSSKEPIYVSSDFKSDWESESASSSISLEINNPSTSHSIEMELFLADCDIKFEDERTRKLLKEGGIKSWTDLIPSVQLTESTLTSMGIDRQIANRLMTEAQARYSKLHGIVSHIRNHHFKFKVFSTQRLSYYQSTVVSVSY